MKLIPGSKLKAQPGVRVAGMWAFWTDARYPSGEQKPRDKIRFYCQRVKKRMGYEVKAGHSRLWLTQVWLLPADAPVEEHWPKYDYGSNQVLKPDEAFAVFADLGVENLEDAIGKRGDAGPKEADEDE